MPRHSALCASGIQRVILRGSTACFSSLVAGLLGGIVAAVSRYSPVDGGPWHKNASLFAVEQLVLGIRPALEVLHVRDSALVPRQCPSAKPTSTSSRADPAPARHATAGCVRPLTGSRAPLRPDCVVGSQLDHAIPSSSPPKRAPCPPRRPANGVRAPMPSRGP